MSSAQSHCRLCAEPYALSRLVCLEDEERDIKKKMLLINVDVSTPSPLPRGVCYSCLFLLERTCSFLYQVSAAQRKLKKIYQDNKGFVKESDNMYEEPREGKRAEFKIEFCRDELPEGTDSMFTEPALKREHQKVEKNCDVNEQNIVIKIPESWLESRSKEKEKLPKRRYCVRPKPDSYPCHICGKAYKKRQVLTEHLKTHKERPFACDICKKSFVKKYTLKCHITMHSGERSYSCKTCGLAFRLKHQLRMHANIHTGEKSHVCSDCGKGFRLKNTLDEHRNVHTGVKPYSCEFCGHQFRTQSNYYKHARRVHGADPIKQKISNVETGSAMKKNVILP